MDIPEIATFAAALLAVLALIIAIAWVLRRFFGGSDRSAAPTLRRRNRRLGIVEGVQIGNRHRLLLVRRDDTEHLLLIGGATEVVVESGIPHPDAEAEVNIRAAEPRFGASGPSLGEGGGGLDRSSESADRGYSSRSFPRPDFTQSYRDERDAPAQEPEPRPEFGRSSIDDYAPREPAYGSSGRYDDDDDHRGYRDEEPAPAPRSFGAPGAADDDYDDRDPEPGRYDRREPDDDEPPRDAPGQPQSRILSRFLKRDDE